MTRSRPWARITVGRHGRPTVRVKGRTHPRTSRTVRDPDFQPESCGHRARMEGRCLCLSISPNARHTNTSRSSRRNGWRCCGDESARNWPTRNWRLPGSTVLELARAEGRTGSPASAERRGVHAGVCVRRRRQRCASCCREIPGSLASASLVAPPGCTSRDAILRQCGCSSNTARIQTLVTSATTRRRCISRRRMDARQRPRSARCRRGRSRDRRPAQRRRHRLGPREGNEAVVNLLLERGARHHIFSVMALRDRDLVQRLVEENPDCLLRRRSRFENSQTPLTPPSPRRRRRVPRRAGGLRHAVAPHRARRRHRSGRRQRADAARSRDAARGPGSGPAPEGGRRERTAGSSAGTARHN